MYNIFNKTTGEYMLGESVHFPSTADRWLAHYQVKSSNNSFEIHKVDFLHPPWFPVELAGKENVP